MASEVRRTGLTRLYSPKNKAASVDIVFVHGLFGHPYDTWTFQVPKPQVILDVGRRRQTSTVDNVKTSRVAADKAHAWASLVKRILRPPDKHVKGQSSSAEASLSTSQSTHQALSSQPGEIDEESAGVSQEEQRAKKPSGTATNARDIFWPRDLLPVALPQANIYTWGYDVDINHVFQSASQASVFHHAGTLLADIANARMSPIDKSRPLIFVAHSLGGIVVKDALQLSHSEKTYLKEILPATVGICFLGTPHRGSATARMGKIAFEISRIFLQKPATSVLRDLEVNSETLDRIGKSFSQILADGRIKVHSFAEELPTTGIMVVQTFSYSIGDAFETTGTIPSNHSNMTKFSSEKDIGFERVSKVLQRWEAEIQSLSTNEQEFYTVDDAGERMSGVQTCLDSLNWSQPRTRISEVEKTFGDTYQWIFSDQVSFSNWLCEQERESVYWIQGKPGSGKSTLMKFVLRHPHTSNLLGKCHSSPWVQAGFFFHDRGMELQKSINGLLSEMIYQILRKQRRLLPLVLPLFDERVQPRRTLTSSASKSPWYTEDLREALLLIVSQAEEKLNICFFIDALDEHFGNHHELLQTLKDFVTTAGRNSHHVKLCIASRPENVFKAELAKVPGLAIHEHTEGDFQEYVFRRMQPEIDRRDHEQLNDLAKDVVDKAQGVFLWVKLVVDELVEGACDGESVSKLRDFLSDIPSELEDLYRRAIRRVRDRRFSKKLKDKHCGEAFVMFQVALCCRSPYPLVAFINTTSLLVSGIIQENLPLDSQRRPIPTDDMRRQLSARCGGLLETVTGAQHNRTAQKDVVQFIHQTAKEFTQKGEIRAALSEGLSNFPDENGHVLLLRYCVKVVRQDLDLRIPDFLFHARNAEKATRQSQANEINMLIDSGGSQALSNVGRLLTEMDIPKSFNAIREGVRDPKMILLLIAAYGGLKYYLRYEISEVKRSTEDDGRLLAAVIEEMHSRLSIRENPPDSGLITPLLEAGIKPDSPFGGQTALIRAVHPPEDFAYTTDPEVVERLLEAGADVNAQGGRFGNALQAASYQCYEKIVGQLLKAGANINAQGGKFGNALQAASVRGHEKVVEQLLKAGADVNAQGGKFNNALQAALQHGHRMVVQRLLEAGAEANA